MSDAILERQSHFLRFLSAEKLLKNRTPSSECAKSDLMPEESETSPSEKSENPPGVQYGAQ
jgi:hypothetical protein